MPGAQAILDGLGGIANAWWPLAVLWHLYFGALAALLWRGWRPMRRLAAALLAAPLVSVGVLAWGADNPFNGTVFLLGAMVLAAVGLALSPARINTSSRPGVFVGAAVFVFGWIYPHFLETGSYLAYAYAAPTGLVPCPTLSIVIGPAIAFRGLGSAAWASLLAGLGMFYGVFGALYLGVGIDWVLAAAAACLLAQAVFPISSGGRATR